MTQHAWAVETVDGVGDFFICTRCRCDGTRVEVGSPTPTFLGETLSEDCDAAHEHISGIVRGYISGLHVGRAYEILMQADRATPPGHSRVALFCAARTPGLTEDELRVRLVGAGFRLR